MFRFLMTVAALLACAPCARAAYSLGPAQAHAPVSAFRLTTNVAVGDLDGDQRDDVVVIEYPFLAIRLQTAAGALSEPVLLPTPGQSTHALALADMNHDGLLDIVTGHVQGITVFLNRMAAPGQFDAHPHDVFQRATSLAVADVNRDGLLDVVIADGLRVPVVPPLMVIYGDGAGGMLGQQVLGTATAAMSVAAGDIDADGFPDLLLEHQSSSTLGLLYHDRIAGFRAAPVLYDYGLFIGQPVLADLNGDRRADLVTSHWSAAPLELSAVLQERKGAPFRALAAIPTSEWANLMFAGDLDGDRRDDLLVVHHEPARRLGFYLQGAHGLGAETTVPLPVGGSQGTSSISALAAGDLDGDGCRDVALSDHNLGLLVLKGQGCGADLAVAFGADRASVSIGIANVGAQPAAAPRLSLQMTPRGGAVQWGPLPPNCAAQPPTPRGARVDCTLGDLAAGARTTLTIPYAMSEPDRQNALTVSVQASTATPEAGLANNSVWKLVSWSPAAKKLTKRNAVGSKGSDRESRSR